MNLRAAEVEAKATKTWGMPAYVIPYRIAGNRYLYAVTDQGALCPSCRLSSSNLHKHAQTGRLGEY